jgi:hypothetical protein
MRSHKLLHKKSTKFLDRAKEVLKVLESGVDG